MPTFREIDAALRSRNEKKRWAAAIDAGDLLYTRPRTVWKLILEHGSSRSDVRRQPSRGTAVEGRSSWNVGDDAARVRHHFEPKQGWTNTAVVRAGIVNVPLLD